MSKKRKIVIAAVMLGLLAAVFLNPVSLWLIGMAYSINKEEAALCKPEAYMSAGEILALYCQSYSLLQSYFIYGDVRLPKAFDRQYPSVKILKQEATAWYGSGFYHFGYELSLDSEASSPSENVWQLHLFREDKESRHLATIRMDTNRRLTPDEILEIKEMRTEK